MRIIADEMISPKIVSVITETFIRSGWQYDSVHKANLRGRADEDWIATFARTGGHAIISGDRKMLKREALVEQISQTGLIAIYLPASWAASGRHEQLAYCLHWWKKTEEVLEGASPGSIWLSPNGMARGELRQYINPQKAKREKQESARKLK